MKLTVFGSVDIDTGTETHRPSTTSNDLVAAEDGAIFEVRHTEGGSET